MPLSVAASLPPAPTLVQTFLHLGRRYAVFVLMLMSAALAAADAKPVITNPSPFVCTVGTPTGFAITATNAPTSYKITGLPAPLGYDAGTGAITGTPTAKGTYNITLQATNGGGTGSKTIAITFNPPPPVITSLSPPNGQVGALYSFTLTAANGASFHALDGSLPPGLTESGAVISGNPTSAGTYLVPVVATNAGGSDSENLSFTILPAKPVISSPLTATGTQGTFFGYTIGVNNTTVDTRNATPLPNGLTVSFGKITGIPTVSGTFNITISATNAGGTTSQVLSLKLNPAPPVITTTALPPAQVGVAYSVTLTATGAATFSTIPTLPAGLTLSGAVISGRPTSVNGSPFSMVITATNAGGTNSTTLPLTVLPPKPVISSPLTTTGTQGSAFSYAIGVTNTTVDSYGIGTSTLPNGLTIDTTTGIISGTPTVSGTFSVTITATNVVGTASQVLSLKLNPAPPVITTTSLPGGQVGVAYSVTLTATGAATYTTSPLPDGLTLTGAVISGRPTSVPSGSNPVPVIITATNAGGSNTATLGIHILPAKPVITVANTTITGQVGVPFGYEILVTNTTVDNYSVSTLPAGLTRSGRDLITGTPTVSGTTSVTLTAQNKGGNGTALVTFKILPAPPVITSATSVTGRNGSYLAYQVTATNHPTSYTCTVTPSLPTGLTFTTTGLLSGRPTVAGTYTFMITATNPGGSTSQDVTVTLAKAQPFVTWSNPADITYGTALSATQLNATCNFTDGTISYSAVNEASGAVYSHIGDLPVAGTYSITATYIPNDPTDFAAAIKTVTLTVDKAPLTITADNVSRPYGTADGTFTVSYAGFQNGEDETFLTTLPDVTTDRQPISPAGIYALTPENAAADNYDFIYVPGVYTQEKATLTITANDASRHYGYPDPAFTVSYQGFQNGENETALTTLPDVTTNAVSTSPAGPYTLTAKNAAADNYDFNYVPGVYTVDKALLIITPDNKTRYYGYADPAFTVSYQGFQNGEDETALTTPPDVTTDALITNPPGIYTLTAENAASDNYFFIYMPGVESVDKAPLTITADDKSRFVGDPNPSFTISYSGFQNGDDETALTTGADLYIPLAGPDSLPGPYTIRVADATSDDYDITFVNGTFTINDQIPANNDFNLAQAYAGPTSGYLLDATLESGEPLIAGTTGGNSVWYSYVAPADGVITITVNSSDFTPLVGAFDGLSVDSLNSDGSQIGLPFTTVVAAGQTYSIAVDAQDGTFNNVGLFDITITFNPANDNFANAQAIADTAVSGTVFDGTLESGEQQIASTPGGHSVWYSFQAPADGTVQVQVTTSNFNPLIGIYVGNSIDSLRVEDQVDGTTSNTIGISSGQTYYIAVDVEDTNFNNDGTFTIQVLFTPNGSG